MNRNIEEELPTFDDLIRKNLLPIGTLVYVWRRGGGPQGTSVLYKVLAIEPDGVQLESIPPSKNPYDISRPKEPLTTLVVLA